MERSAFVFCCSETFSCFLLGPGRAQKFFKAKQQNNYKTNEPSDRVKAPFCPYMRPKRQAIRSASTNQPTGRTDRWQLPTDSAKTLSTLGDPCPAPPLQTTGPGGAGTDTDWTLQAPGHHVFLPALLKNCGHLTPQEYATSAPAGLAILLLASQILPMLFVLCRFIHFSSWRDLDSWAGQGRVRQRASGVANLSQCVGIPGLKRGFSLMRLHFPLPLRILAPTSPVGGVHLCPSLMEGLAGSH